MSLYTADKVALDRAKDVTEAQFRIAADLMRVKGIAFKDNEEHHKFTIALMQVIASNFVGVKTSQG